MSHPTRSVSFFFICFYPEMCARPSGSRKKVYIKNPDESPRNEKKKITLRMIEITP